jgi:hypothetical protein
MIPEKINVIELAIIIGPSLIPIPYVSQQIIPATNIRYIGSDIAVVFWVLITFTAWGRKLAVVRNAAMFPIIKIRFIY